MFKRRLKSKPAGPVDVGTVFTGPGPWWMPAKGGHRVRLKRGTWVYKIGHKHADIVGREDAILHTLAEPVEVYHNPSDVHGRNVRVYYGSWDGMEFMVVVAEYIRPREWDAYSIYYRHYIQPEGRRIWPPSASSS